MATTLWSTLFLFIASVLSTVSLGGEPTFQDIGKAALFSDLPIILFEDITQHVSFVSIERSESHSYQAGVFPTIRIPEDQYETSPRVWSSIQWADFYRSLFHAWWDLHFSGHKADWERRITAENLSTYRAANSSQPQLAQEYAYAETIAALILVYLSEKARLEALALKETNLDVRDRLLGSLQHDALESLEYKKNRTVEPVGHSEESGFTKRAENIFPGRQEYRFLFYSVFGRVDPMLGRKPS